METILNTPWLLINAKTLLSFLFIMTLKLRKQLARLGGKERSRRSLLKRQLFR